MNEWILMQTLTKKEKKKEKKNHLEKVFFLE